MKINKLLIVGMILVLLLPLCLNTSLDNWNASIKVANMHLAKGIEHYNTSSNAYSIKDMDNVTYYADKSIEEFSITLIALKNGLKEAQKSKKDWLVAYTTYYIKKVEALNNAAVELKILKQYYLNEQEDGIIQSMDNIKQKEEEFKAYDLKMESIKRAHISEFQ